MEGFSQKASEGLSAIGYYTAYFISTDKGKTVDIADLDFRNLLDALP